MPDCPDNLLTVRDVLDAFGKACTSWDWLLLALGLGVLFGMFLDSVIRESVRVNRIPPRKAPPGTTK